MAERQGFFKRLLARDLQRPEIILSKDMDYIFRGFTNIDDEFYEELEEILIMGDIGVTTTENIIRRSKATRSKNKQIKEPGECKELLIESIRRADGCR